MDKNNKKYSLINDNDKFFDIFPPAIYSPENGKKTYLKVNVIEEKDILLSIPGNPKILIEENENLLKILIKNLSAENKLESKIKHKYCHSLNNYIKYHLILFLFFQKFLYFVQ